MKSIPAMLFLVIAYCNLLIEGHPIQVQRHHDSEIKGKTVETLHEAVGVPLVFEENKQGYTRTGVPEIRQSKEDDTPRNSILRDTSKMEEMIGRMKPDSKAGVTKKEDLDDDKEEDDDEKEKKNPEELGQGYEKIGDMGSKNKDDDDGDDQEGSSDTDGDITSDASKISKDKLDLTGELPPTADQVKKLPKEEELTPEEAERQMADKKKGYVQFTIRQKYAPELKYKESAAYKILSGNVVHDVERALKATGVVTDVLFREAKNIGGPPYRSKVQVFLKLKNVNVKKLKKIVNHGLINGMITIPGSFYAI